MSREEELLDSSKKSSLCIRLVKRSSNDDDGVTDKRLVVCVFVCLLYLRFIMNINDKWTWNANSSNKTEKRGQHLHRLSSLKTHAWTSTFHLKMVIKEGKITTWDDSRGHRIRLSYQEVYQNEAVRNEPQDNNGGSFLSLMTVCGLMIPCFSSSFCLFHVF